MAWHSYQKYNSYVPALQVIWLGLARVNPYKTGHIM